ncbi:hypothetical protein GHT06_014444 [Daphnia sinensis]|uniref:Uncharacterized protein n=1 Tax=Daphnia sinensis TaxID=1820382 RepID=A0AAD5KTT2_9CRUS|nr:hypothetical protein GHT06_014444 [Daphnia sinensis]
MVVMRSCCCCSPRTGSLLIAALYMLFTGLVLLGLGLLLAYFNKSLVPLLDTIVRDGPANDLITSNVTSETSSATATRNVIIASIVLNSLYFLLCLLLFIGAVKESWRILMVWTIAEFVRQLLFFTAFVFLVWCFSIFVSNKQMDYGTSILLSVLMLIVIALAFYFWLAVIAATQGYRERERHISPKEIKLAYPHSDLCL